MALIMRTFRSRPQQQAVVLGCLSFVASALIRYLGATSIIIFRDERDPRQFLWVGDRGTEADFAGLSPPPTLMDALEDSPVGASPGCVLALVDEYCRFPRPGYQLWSVEACAPKKQPSPSRADLLLSSTNPRLVAAALYRAISEPGGIVTFLGLAWGVTPSGLGLPKLGAAPLIVRGPLVVACDASRAFPGPGEAEHDRSSRVLPWLVEGQGHKPPAVAAPLAVDPSRRRSTSWPK
jgi:hypothetical protein